MSIFARSLLLFGALAIGASVNAAQAQTTWTETILLDFTESGAAAGLGFNPQMGVLRDSAGIYGSAYNGGANSGGTIYFRSGSNLRALYSFSNQPYSEQNKNTTRCGFHPSARLIKNGRSLYGTTYEGGQFGGGVVFKLVDSNDPNKQWTCNVLHSFSNTGSARAQGYASFGGLVQGADGALYGTAQFNARTKDSTGVIIPTGGVVFRLRSTANGWGYKVLHTFSVADRTAGLVPTGPLTEKNGVLYGATFFGGLHDGGVVYKMLVDGSGFQVLWTFQGNAEAPAALRGYRPTQGPLLVDASGAVYGETATGGKQADGSFSTGGVVFQLVPKAQPPYGYKVLYNFDSNNSPQLGFGPIGGLAMGPDGFLYGNTQFGGAAGGGSVFRLTGANKNTFELLFDFPDGSLGFRPSGPLSIGGAGNLVGTTFLGGAQNGGVVFQLKKP